MRDVFHNRMTMRGGIALAILLLYLISGGFPPDAWVTLSRVASSPQTPGAINRLDLLSPPFILGVQSLFLAVAWAILLWLAINEMASAVLSTYMDRNISPPARHDDSNAKDKHTAPTIPDQAIAGIPLQGSPRAVHPQPLAPSPSLHNASTVPIQAYERSGGIPPSPPLPTPVVASQRMAQGQKPEKQQYETMPSIFSELSPRTEVGSSETRTGAGRTQLGTTLIETKPVSTVLTARQDPALSFQSPLLPAPIHSVPRAHAVTHTGLVRAHKPNEDSYLHIAVARHSPPRPPQWAGLFLVADGMGGHTHGKYASSRVVHLICEDIEPVLRDPQWTSEELKAYFVQAVQRANKQLFQENQVQGVFRGTTVTGVIILEEARSDDASNASAAYVAHIINVGDSRTYRYSTRGFSRITRDHSTVEELIESKVISPEERYTHQRRNEIYRCLGDKENIEVDAFTIALQPRDRLLLCTDGLWEMVRDTDLGWLLAMSTNDPAQITELLLRTALTQGGHDNVTALVIMMPGYQGG
jgi:serine/threonine protein phosphatase PrpC